MSIAFLSASAVWLSIVLDHYDRRDNQRFYMLFRRIFTLVGWWSCGLALVYYPLLSILR